MIDQILVISVSTFLMMISPGPDMVIVIRNTFTGGRSAGLLSSLGILTGNMIHITYCAVGIDLVFLQSVLAFTHPQIRRGRLSDLSGHLQHVLEAGFAPA